MPSRHSFTAFLLSALLGAVDAADGQAAVPRVVTDTQSCSACTITLTRGATLRLRDDAFFGIVNVSSDGRGRVFVAPTADHVRFAVFDSTGKLLRTVGRKGSGPGEYQHVFFISPGRGDTLHVFDLFGQRRTVLAPDLSVVRTSPIPHQIFQAVQLRSGAMIVQGVIRTPDRIGFPLHLLTPAGEVVASFGAPRNSEFSPLRGLIPYLRHITPASATSVWSVPPRDYRLEEWDEDGRQLRVLQRRASWFMPRPDAMSEDQSRPGAHIRGISHDPSGLLWVATTIAKQGWKPDPKWAGRDTTRERPPMDPGDLGKYVDTVIEVIDPLTGRLEKAARFPAAILGFAGPRLVYSRESSADGEEFIQLWRLTYQKPLR